jgi:hypothetical protein
MESTTAAPERSLDQRIEALVKANEIRTARKEVKAALKAGKTTIAALILDPPEYMLTAKVRDFLLATPKVGRVKTSRIMNDAVVSWAKTFGGLTDRQRTELCVVIEKRGI